MSSNNEVYGVDRQVVYNGMRFLNALTQAYGVDRGMAAWDTMRKEFGENIAGAIFFAQLGGGVYERVRITNPGSMKIKAIKEIRGATGLGLRESKDFVEGNFVYDFNGDAVEADRLIARLNALNKEYGLQFEAA